MELILFILLLLLIIILLALNLINIFFVFLLIIVYIDIYLAIKHKTYYKFSIYNSFFILIIIGNIEYREKKPNFIATYINKIKYSNQNNDSIIKLPNIWKNTLSNLLKNFYINNIGK